MSKLPIAIEGKLKAFEFHGVNINKEEGQELIGDCPFCGKENHFFLNRKKILYDCKRCGERGDYFKFLGTISELYTQTFNESRELRLELSHDRGGIPTGIFKEWEVGYNPGRKYYTIPVRDGAGNVIDIRRFYLGSKCRSTPGCRTGLLGVDQIIKFPKERIFICEGEWDTFALSWLLRETNEGGIAVGVPGANVFKGDWIQYLSEKDVWILFDNDEAGQEGQRSLIGRLGGIARSIQGIQWPVSALRGFDVRDWTIQGLKRLKSPLRVFRNLLDLCHEYRKGEKVAKKELRKEIKIKDPSLNGKDHEIKDFIYSRAEVNRIFSKWLLLRSEFPLAVMFGSVFANLLIEGDPVWMFFVAPPGGMKSELLMTLGESLHIISRDSLTPHALVSGMQFGPSGMDPSLIPKLDGKVLVIKDFTTTLGMPQMIREEIFAQLRSAYDGKIEKQFGNGVIRRYESKFGIIAGVTPNIDAFAGLAALGERFLKYRMGEGIKHLNEEERIIRALQNVNREVAMRQELGEVVRGFLEEKVKKYQEDHAKGNGVYVDMDRDRKLVRRIMAGAMLACKLRGVINRDTLTNIIKSPPSYEVGTRMSKQLLKLAMGSSIWFGEKGLTKKGVRVALRVGRDSVPKFISQTIDILAKITLEYEGIGNYGIGKDEIARLGGPSSSTVYRICEDLHELGVLKTGKGGLPGRRLWRLSEEVMDLIMDTRDRDLEKN